MSRGNGVYIFPSACPPGVLTSTGSTNDGSTNAFVVRDSDNEIVAFYDTDGFQRIEYRDEFPGGTWETPQGATAPDVVTATIGGVPFRLRSFDGAGTTETISNDFEINHCVAIDAINAGDESLEWHIHMMPSDNGAGNVRFVLSYCYLPYDYTTPPAAIPQDPIEIVQAISANTQYRHYIKGALVPVPAGGFGIGGKILFNVTRDPSNAGDTYESDILFLQTALHIPMDSRGSRQRYIK